MNTQELIDRFLDGETTVEEEQELCRRFLAGPVDPELEPYAEFFRDMATLPVNEKPRRRLRLVRRWMAAAAVVAAVVVAGVWGYVCLLKLFPALMKIAFKKRSGFSMKMSLN